jgi:hypothetical protein
VSDGSEVPALMLALYRAGRQDEALRAYQEGRWILADQLGVEPSVPLRRLHRDILRTEVSLDPPGATAVHPRAGPPVAAVPRTRTVPPAEGATRRTPTRLVGRGCELAALQDLLLRHRLVTVTGPAGIGKTRLALEASSRLSTERGSSRDSSLLAATCGHGHVNLQERVEERPANPVRGRRLPSCDMLGRAIAYLPVAWDPRRGSLESGPRGAPS